MSTAQVLFAVATGMFLGVLIGYRVGFNRAKQRAVEIIESTYGIDDLVGRSGLLTPEQHLHGLQANIRRTLSWIRYL